MVLGCLIGAGGMMLPGRACAQNCVVGVQTYSLLVYTNLYKYSYYPEFTPYNNPPGFTNSVPLKYYRLSSIYSTGTAFYRYAWEYHDPDVSMIYDQQLRDDGIRMLTQTSGVATACYRGSVTNVEYQSEAATGYWTNWYPSYVSQTSNVAGINCDGSLNGPVWQDPTWGLWSNITNFEISPTHRNYRGDYHYSNGGAWWDPAGPTYSIWTNILNSTWDLHLVLDDEYTTGQLRTNALNALASVAWPTNASGDPAWQGGGAWAANVLSSDEGSLEVYKCRYRFEIPTEVNQHYLLSWKVYTTTVDSYGVAHETFVHRSSTNVYTGTGSNVVTEEFSLDLPAEGRTVEVREPYAQVISAACARVTFDFSSLYVCKGEVVSLSATVFPPGTAVQWFSSSPSVAVVTGAPPSVVILASTNPGVTTIQGVVSIGGINNTSAPVTVTVVDVQIPGPLVVGTAGTNTFAATISPAGLAVTFATENATVATASGSGSSVTLTGVSEGQTHLWAFINGNKLPCFEAGIIVSNVPSVSFSASELTLCVSNTVSLVATVVPATNTLTYDCADTNIASVAVSASTNLTITGLAPGTTQVRARLGTLVLGTATLTVVQVVLPPAMLVRTNNSADFATMVQPASLAGQISYASDDPTIIAVSGSGTQFTVTGVSNGTANVTAWLNGTELCRSATVTVSNNVPLVVLPSLISVCHGGSGNAAVTVLPTTASVTFLMVDPAVATVGALSAGAVPVTGGTNSGITQLRAMFGTNLLASTEVRSVRVDFPANDLTVGVGAIASYVVTVTPFISAADISFDTAGTNAVVSSASSAFSLSGVSAGTVTVRAVLGGSPICDSRTYTITNSPLVSFASNTVYLCQSSAITLGVTLFPTNLPVTYEIVPSNGIVSSVVGFSNHVVITGGATNGAAMVYAKSGSTTLAMLDVSVLQITFPTNQMITFGTAPASFLVEVLPVGDAGVVSFMTTNTNIVTVSGSGTNLQVSGVSNGVATVYAMLGTNQSCASATVIRTNGLGAYFSPPSLAFCSGTNGFLSCTAAPPSLALSFEVVDAAQGYVVVSGPTNGVYELTFFPWAAGTNTIRAMYGTNLLAQADVMAVAVDFGVGGLTLLAGTTNQFTPIITPTQAVSVVSFVSATPLIFQSSWLVSGGTSTVTVAASPTNTGVGVLNAYVGSNQLCSSLPVTVGNLILQTNSVMVCPGTTNRVGYTLSPTNFPVTWTLATNTTADFSLDPTNLLVTGLAPGTNLLSAWFGTNVIAQLQITTLGIDFGTNDLIVLAGGTNHFFTLLTPASAGSTNITYRVDPTNAIAVVSGSNTTFSATGGANTNGYTLVQAMLGTNVLCNAAALTVLEFSISTNPLPVCEGGSASRPVRWAPTNVVIRPVDLDTNITASAMVGTNLVVNGVTNGTSSVNLFAGTNLLATVQVMVIRISVPTNELVIALDQRVSYPVTIVPASAKTLLRFVPADTNTASSFYTNDMVHVVGRLDGDTMIVPMVGTNALCAIRNLAVTNCACRCLPGETTFDFSEGLHLRMNLGLRDGGRTACGLI